MGFIYPEKQQLANLSVTGNASRNSKFIQHANASIDPMVKEFITGKLFSYKKCDFQISKTHFSNPILAMYEMRLCKADTTEVHLKNERLGKLNRHMAVKISNSREKPKKSSES
jgi:hypothetical protein